MTTNTAPNLSIAYHVRQLIPRIKDSSVDDTRKHYAVQLTVVLLKLLHQVELTKRFNYKNFHDWVDAQLETMQYLCEYPLKSNSPPLFVSAFQSHQPIVLDGHLSIVWGWVTKRNQDWSRAVLVLCDVIQVLIDDRPTEVGFWYSVYRILQKETDWALTVILEENDDSDVPPQEPSDTMKFLHMTEALCDQFKTISSQIESLKQLSLPPELESLTKIIGGFDYPIETFERWLALLVQSTGGKYDLPETSESHLRKKKKKDIADQPES